MDYNVLKIMGDWRILCHWNFCKGPCSACFYRAVGLSGLTVEEGRSFKIIKNVVILQDECVL